MNLSHLRYAVEISKTGSVTKAAENLFMGQPNLSKAIKELESSMGITIFKRTSRGLVPTEKGEEFISHAKRIIVEIDDFESRYKATATENQTFSISIPRGSYMAYSFVNFIKKLNPHKDMEIHYKETNSLEAINNIIEANYNLAIIRYRDIFEPYFSRFLQEKELKSQPVWQFRYRVVMSSEHRLAKKKSVLFEDLADSIEILHSDNTVPTLPALESRRMERIGDSRKKICVFERGSQFELLSTVPDTFMWVSPIPKKLLSAYNLVEKTVSDVNYCCKDMLVYQNHYKLSQLDNMYIDELRRVIDTLEKED